MKVSFICPVYNKLKFLPEVTKAIFNQVGTFDREYIFIDDGSLDGSLEAIKKLTKKKKFVKIISHDNRGPAFSTQRGIELAKGDFIKLIGGDDYIFPKCTSLLLNGILKDRSVAIFSKFILKDYLNEKIDRNLFKNKLINYRKIDFPIKDTLLNCFSGTSPTLYCNQAIKKSKGCNIKLFVEDFSLALELSKFGSFAFVDNITSVGPKNDKNRIMLNNEVQLFHDYNAAIYYFLKNNDIIESSWIKKIASKCVGRSEKYSRRVLKISIFNYMNLLKIKLFLFKYSRNQLISFIKQSCKYLYKTPDRSKIRYKVY